MSKTGELLMLPAEIGWRSGIEINIQLDCSTLLLLLLPLLVDERLSENKAD